MVVWSYFRDRPIVGDYYSYGNEMPTLDGSIDLYDTKTTINENSATIETYRKFNTGDTMMDYIVPVVRSSFSSQNIGLLNGYVLGF